MIGNAILAAGHLAGVKLGVAEIGPQGGDVHGVGADAQFETSMHVGGNLEPRGGRGCDAACSGLGDGELGKAVADAFELQQRREEDVHIGLAASRLVQAGNRVGCEDAHGNLLGDEGLAIAAHVVVKGDIEAVFVAAGRRGDAARQVGRRGGDNGEGENRHVILFGQTELR